MSLFGRGQTGEITLTISTPVYYDTVYEMESLKVANIINTTISGQYESNQSVSIVAKPGTCIRVVGNPPEGSVPDPVGGGGGGGTTIRSRPPIGPRMASTSTSDSVSNVTIFPNPVEREFTLQLKNEKIIAFSIFDLSGNKKTDEKIEPSYEHKIDVSMLSEGSYILQIITEKNQYTSIQFIKK